MSDSSDDSSRSPSAAVSASPARSVSASTNDSYGQLRLLMNAQQLQGQASEMSPSLMAHLFRQQQHQLQNQQLSPQILAFLQLQQRQQQEQLLALQLAQLQQQNQQPQLGSLYSGLGRGATSLEALMAQQQLIQQQQIGPSLTAQGAPYQNGSDANTQLSAAAMLTELHHGKVRAKPPARSTVTAIPKSTGPTCNGEGCAESQADDQVEGADSDGEAHDTFPFKLYRMLMEAEKNGQEDIISFNTSGKCFTIHKPRVFLSDLMPKYFTTSRMSSFQRQLNLYGFHRVAEGVDKGAYFHEHFLRGRKSQCRFVRRKKPSIKLQPSAIGYLLSAANGADANQNTNTLSVRQMIANGQLSTEQQILASAQQTNPALAAALLMEKQRQQTDLVNQLVLRQHQERELERQLMEQARENEQKRSK